MYKRIIIVSIIILAALCGLTWLGYHSIQIQARGMKGARLGEFAEVAEQIKQDVKRKLDEFMQTEQNRPYTDYQYYYVPENVAATQQQMPLLRSPLGDSINNDLGLFDNPYVLYDIQGYTHNLLRYAWYVSDIDILINFRGNQKQKEYLLIWLDGWSQALAEINKQKTGYSADGLLDVHLVTDEDIKNKTSYAVKIGAITDAARPIKVIE